jgi:hypothetical protein
MNKFSVQSLPVHDNAPESQVPANDQHAGKTLGIGLAEAANDQLEILPMMSAGGDGNSTTSGPPDQPTDPDPDKTRALA